MGTKKLNDDVKKQIISLFNEKKLISEIANKLNISTTSVRRYIKLEFPNANLHYTRKKYSINENYFEKINTPNKAYFLGLMYADGTVRKRKNSFSFKLALITEDDEVIHFFKKELESNQPFFYYKRSQINKNWKDVTEYAVTNNKLVNDLVKLNCFYNKTSYLTFPTFDIVPHHLMSHFIRGYFDGDGSICINKNKKKNVLRFEGTLEFVTGLQNFLSKELNCPFTKIQKRHKDRTSNAYTLQYYGTTWNNNCKLFKDYFYKDAEVFLKRKYNKFI